MFFFLGRSLGWFSSIQFRQVFQGGLILTENYISVGRVSSGRRKLGIKGGSALPVVRWLGLLEQAGLLEREGLLEVPVLGLLELPVLGLLEALRMLDFSQGSISSDVILMASWNHL